MKKRKVFIIFFITVTVGTIHPPTPNILGIAITPLKRITKGKSSPSQKKLGDEGLDLIETKLQLQWPGPFLRHRCDRVEWATLHDQIVLKRRKNSYGVQNC